jgi:hypothetical protein
MSAAKRLVVLAGLFVFVAAIALKPLLSNPALTGVIGGGGSLGTAELLLLVPTVAVAVLVVAARLWRLFGADSDDADSRYAARRSQPPQGNHWGVDDESTPTHEAAGEQAPESVSQILGGQGGARDREFEIEREAPDADLGAHLDHLRSELDDDASVELETLEEVVEETEDESPIPERCPQPHCDAAWAERGILDIKNGRYELLEDGQKAQCLDCEAVVTLDDTH